MKSSIYLVASRNVLIPACVVALLVLGLPESLCKEAGADDNRTAYLKELEAGARSLHTPALSHLWEQPPAKGEWGGPFEIRQEWACVFATLYHFNGKAEYRELAKKYLLDFGGAYHFSSIALAHAYEIMEGDLSQAERAEFARAWTASARGGLLGRVGTVEKALAMNYINNHVLGSCVHADLVRKLFPVESEQYHYDRLTDAAWKVWWDRREFWEQAMNYEAFSLPFHCVWAQLRGVEQEYYGSPSVRNMLLRSQRIISPAGIVSPYGDTCACPIQGFTYVALLELVASKMKRGDLKCCARDVFDCMNRLRWREGLSRDMEYAGGEKINERMVCRSYTLLLSWLAMAAYWTDPDLVVEPREPCAGVVRRTPLGYKLKESDKKSLPTKIMLDQQVALTGGPPEPDKQTYVLFSVGKRLHHDHADAGAIQLLSRGDTVFLGTNGYLQRELLYHNVFFLQEAGVEKYPEDSAGRAFMGARECKGRIVEFSSSGKTSYCKVVFDPYHGYPASLTREILVDESGRVLLTDTLEVRDKALRGGPLFHGEAIRKVGQRRYRLRTDTLHGMEGITVTNPPGELEVQFLSGEGNLGICSPALPSVYTSKGYQSFPCSVYAKLWQTSYTARKCLHLSREFAPGTTHTFVTRLAPL